MRELVFVFIGVMVDDEIKNTSRGEKTRLNSPVTAFSAPRRDRGLGPFSPMRIAGDEFTKCADVDKLRVVCLLQVNACIDRSSSSSYGLPRE